MNSKIFDKYPKFNETELEAETLIKNASKDELGAMAYWYTGEDRCDLWLRIVDAGGAAEFLKAFKKTSPVAA